MNDPIIATLEQAESRTGEAARVWESTKEKASAVAGEAAHAWENTKGKASEVLQSSERYVREHPGTSVLGVFGAGMLVGALVAWSVAHEQRDDTAASIHRFLAGLGRKLNLD
ncbi:hypothetical protein [Prosthecobacter sp.]|uniref:hypothetical protein n=1 Tax=Prosthecobacter sp. TaxID=1965333 RepID=UPI002AB9DC59|nr:hypothetical protein [Prosthecobacter sp.]MDZ4401171.1 hypothetical protein [Prosthecobacter sp.]